MAVRLAFAGTGYIAKVHARAARKLSDVSLVAVVNHRRPSMEAFARDFAIARQYTRIEDLLADGGVDAICISTPNYLHAPQTIAALEAGVHVLVEKPMATNAREARAMIEASQRTGALLMVAHCWRFDKDVQWLKEHVDAGRLGRIVRTKSYGVHARWGPGGWFTKKQLAGGGALVDMGVHAIDTTRFLIGDPWPVRVYARIHTYYGDYDVDDTGVLLVEWDNGVVSYVESGWWQPHTDGPEAATRLYGTRGYGSVFPTYVDIFEPHKGRSERIESGFPFPRADHCPQDMYDRQMAYFIDCVRQHRPPVPGGKEGWVNMLIIDAAYESARSHRVVTLDS